MNNKDMENKFAEAFQEQLEKAETACGKGCPQLSAQAAKLGAASAVKDMLKRGRVSENFDALQKAGKLQFSVEVLVTRSEFGELFTDTQVDACLAVLCDCGYYG